MKMKLAAFLAATMLTLAGCGGGASNSGNTTSPANASNTNKASNTTSSTSKSDDNVVMANANASDETGGTKEGCKCSAVGMKCSTKAGEKGCCGKDGECSTMVDGKSSCCASKGSEGAACCSTAGKVASTAKPGEKPATAPAASPSAKKG